MPDIMVVLACLSQCVPPTPRRQLGRVIEALLSISGRITMKGLSRWSDKGGSYRTIQRLFNTPLNWLQLNWLLIRHPLWDGDEVALMSGDHVVVTKSGKTTHGLDRFFSSRYGKAVPGLCFLSLSLLSVKHHVLSRGDRASGQAVGRAGSSPGEAKEEVGWLPRASQRAPASPSSRGGPQPIAAVYSAAHQAVAGADWRYLQRGVFYL